MKTVSIKARYAHGGCTYIAGPVAGKTASGTAGPEAAVRALAAKLYGDAVVSVTAKPSTGDLFISEFTVRVKDEATQ